VTDDERPPEYKQCPDCAEHVLAAARKCRYCGYRFDGKRTATRTLLDTLIPGLRRDTREATFEEILADWGISLEADESVEWFRLADVDDRPGYVLVTSRRLLFFRQVSRTQHERELEYPLGLISEVHMSGGPLKRRLELRAGVLGHAIHTPGHRDLDQLCGRLQVAIEHKHAATREG
jgi:hypothetical protein